MSAVKLRFASSVGLLAVLLGLETAKATDEVNTAVIGQVRETWKSRCEAIKTFHYECELKQRVTKPARPGASDLFGDAPVGTPTIDVELLSTIAFSCYKGKRAFKMDGQQWDEQQAVPKDYMFHATFDGVYRHLLKGQSFPHGFVDRRPIPESDLITLTHLTAFWLAFDPDTYLEARAYDTDKMQVTGQRVGRNGRNDIELRIPRSNPKWDGLLFVDPKRAYVPTEFKEVHNGVAVAKLEIQYIPNREAGWVVSAWLQQQLYPSGRPSSSAKAKVKRCVINSDLDDGLFKLPLPTGCHIVEIAADGTKYFVQLRDGTRTEISESEYGRVRLE
jgi:hypothetical protein